MGIFWKLEVPSLTRLLTEEEVEEEGEAEEEEEEDEEGDEEGEAEDEEAEEEGEEILVWKKKQFTFLQSDTVCFNVNVLKYLYTMPLLLQ